MSAPRGLRDTSVFIAQEQHRELAIGALRDEGIVSVITLAELQAGVLATAGTDARSQRLKTQPSH